VSHEEDRNRALRCPDYLDDEEVIAEYLTAALEDRIPIFSWCGARRGAGARHGRSFARDTGWDWREPLQGAGARRKARYDTVLKVVARFRVKLP